MKVQIKILAIGFILNPILNFSQEQDSIPSNGYIEIMGDKLSVKIDVDNDIETFSAEQSGIEFKIKPNIDYRTELSVHYRFISFKLGFSPHLFTNFDKENKGKTKVFKFETDFYIKKWIQTLSYSQTKGYYSPDFPVPDNFPTDYLILNKLKVYNYKGITRYRFNPNYSIKAITTQTEIQRKSAGTFMPSLTYSYNQLKNGATNQQLNTFNFILSAGYLHTFVINKKLYASIGAAPGAGVDFNKIIVKIDSDKITDNDTNYTFNFDGHLGLGYNSNQWFGGGFFRLLTTTRKETTIVNYDTFRTHFQVFIGYRFGAPKFLEKQADWVEEKIPF
ncbi:MAG: DUF4421 domain-containing protein [Flavobacteriaceae bacterium]|nr:DUF4421 domain-containing protein [Flavobacteriaceae bacterium]